MGDDQIEKLNKLISDLPNKEEFVTILQRWIDASGEDRTEIRIELDRIFKIGVKAQNFERARQHKEKDQKQAILSWKLSEYETAPPAKKSGKPEMYFAWNVYVYAKEHDVEVPEKIKDRVDRHVMSIAKRAIAKRKDNEKDYGKLKPEEFNEWHDRKIAGYIHSQKEVNPKISIEDLAHKLQDLFEKEREDFIKFRTKRNLSENESWSKTKARLAATEQADKFPDFTRNLDQFTIERIYRRIKKRN